MGATLEDEGLLRALDVPGGDGDGAVGDEAAVAWSRVALTSHGCPAVSSKTRAAASGSKRCPSPRCAARGATTSADVKGREAHVLHRHVERGRRAQPPDLAALVR